MDDRHKEVLLRTMRDFMKFCGKAGLRWYLAFGASIGAVRHKGMIPWDDDIDVYMPRADYERFLAMKGRIGEIAGGSLEGEYDIFGPRVSSEDMPFQITKFCDMNSSIWEQERYPSVYGVFIDVFPLDNCTDDIQSAQRFKDSYHQAFKHYRRSFRRHTFRAWIDSLKEGNLHYCTSTLLDLFYYRPRKKSLKERFIAMDKSLSGASGDWLITYAAYSDASKVAFPAGWAASSTEVPFENMSVPVPSGNDMILRKIYGDYMQLPAKFERISNHGQYFMDFTRRMTVDEIRTEIDKGLRDKYSG
ncbi:MAG: phosphorylcholine transferase LicD [Candidatus Cryptobacteroides sp.]|nr:LicD family protein [Bacteroidales bacterium]